MKDKAGNLKKRCPDRKTEAGAAYSRVKAVYGRVDELEKLEDKQGVTQHLGTVKRICAETVSEAAAGGSPARVPLGSGKEEDGLCGSRQGWDFRLSFLPHLFL